MTGRGFYDSVRMHSDLEWLGTYDDEHVGIRNKRTDCWWGIPLSEILEHAWEEFLGIFEGTRECRCMTQMSRIVGYYSFMHVWNGSKLAEARDRAKGDYAVAK